GDIAAPTAPGSNERAHACPRKRHGYISLGRALLPLGELGPCFFFPFAPEPQRVTRCQIAHHGEELLLLAQIDLIHSHLPQRRLPSFPCPALQIAQIDGSHRAAGQPKLSRHTPHRGTLTGQPHSLFEALAKRRFARQLRHFLRLDPAVRTAHPIQLHHHRRQKLETGQITYLPLVAVIGMGQLPPTTRANQFLVPMLAPNPQFQRLALLIDFVLVDPISRPPQYFCPVRLSHTAECNQSPLKSNCPLIRGCYRLLCSAGNSM